MNLNKTIYTLSIADLQTVAQQEFGRKLIRQEIEIISEKIGENINWYDAIQHTINQHLAIE